MPDPVSWLQIEQGWHVVSSDGDFVGTVVQIAGDKREDIFDGLAVRSSASTIGYVPGEQIGSIVPGTVTLRLTAAEASDLDPYREAAAQTTFHPGDTSLRARLSGWLGGKR